MKNYIDPYDSSKYIEEKETHIEAKGGDGTLIKAIHMFEDTKKPFFGIAGGTANFMMNDEETITDSHEICEFNLINVYVYYIENNVLKTKCIKAFNDIIIGEFNAWIEFNCEHDENLLGKFMGSAILISTTQGSTAANKNNQGPVMSLCSKQWAVSGVMTNRNIRYNIDPEQMTINCKSRGNIKINVDGSYFEVSNVQKVILTQGKLVNVVFNDYKKFQERRQLC